MTSQGIAASNFDQSIQSYLSYMSASNTIPASQLANQMQMIATATRELGKEFQNKSKEQFEAEIEVLKTLLEDAKDVFAACRQDTNTGETFVL